MWELMRIGMEMQERMIEVQGHNLDMMRSMMDAVQKQGDIGQAALEMSDAMNLAGKAQADLAGKWMNFWSGRS